MKVEMFGLAPFSDLNEVEVETAENATLADVVSALRATVPVFGGRVIQSDRDRLVENYGFYVNGEFAPDETLHVTAGDRIVLLLLATGG